MKLREYQQDAHAALVNFINTKDGNPLVVAPTGSGKSLLIASFIKDFATRKTLVVQHRSELVLQNHDKIRKLAPEVYSTVFSASVGEKNIRGSAVFANIQSVFKLGGQLPKFDFLLIDECHRLPPSGEGQYQTLIDSLKTKNEDLRIVGFTATPFRMTSGSLVDDGGFFTDICYEIEMSRLIKDGFLSPLVSKSAVSTPDLKELRVQRGDYAISDINDLYIDKKLSQAVLREVKEYARDRKSILVFSSSVKHAEFFAKFLRESGESADTITGSSGSLLREQIINNFKSGKLRFLVSVDVFTEGFDAPNVDCLIVLRPTKSPGLHCQMLGRGMRLNPGKLNCLVLDFAGNTLEHGPVDQIRVVKKAKKNERSGEYEIRGEVEREQKLKLCIRCRNICFENDETCSSCGYEFPVDVKHEAESADVSPMGAVQAGVFVVQSRDIRIHEKMDKPPNLRIDYTCGFNFVISEFLCFEHGGFAARQALIKWKMLTEEGTPIPKTTVEALSLSHVRFREVAKIKAIKQGDFWRITAYKWGKTENDETRDELYEKYGLNI